jgi:histidyl-tRNA synthetase
VIALGKNELDDGFVKLKEMATGSEFSLNLDNIVADVKRIISFKPS